MTSLPSHIQQRFIPHVGNGLFTSKAIDAGEEILRIERPLVAVLNQNQLVTACEWCFIWVPEEEETATTKLRACQGCKIVRYCSKACQRSSWQHHHRHECKIFHKLYPNVLPNTVRILLQLLLRRKSKSLPDTDWQSLLSLQSHLSDFRSSPTTNTDGLTTHQTIELMSQAAKTYSSSSTEDEPLEFFHSLTATTLINALTLTTPHFDPLGLTLCPKIALLNHSCTPNTAITYSRSTLSLHSLHPIPPTTELTISYIDTTQPTPTRQTELRERYFFTCTCSSCSTNSTSVIPDLPPSTDLKARSVKAIELQNEASSASSPAEAAPLLSQALEILSIYPPTQQPYAAILHTAFLNAIALPNYSLALTYKLYEYFFIDPTHYQPSFHPIRVVRKWVLLRLMTQIAGLVGEGDASVASLMKFEVEWHVVVFYLFREVEEGVGRSHGRESVFGEEVRAFGRELGVEGGVGPGVEGEVKEREWRKLRRIGEGGGERAGGRKLLE